VTDKIPILYIDDELSNLHAFNATLRKKYRIFLAQSAAEGIKVLSENEICVIITDQRMPQMTGVEFFESIINKYPDPVRILMTAYADIEAVIDSINKGHIYRFIRKPWEEHDLINAIENAIELFDAKKQLKEKNIQLQKANDELNRFVYSASHDLKAPLLSILGIIKVAELENKEKGMDRHLVMIENSVKKLEIFIQNIINYYKNIRIKEYYNPVDLQQIVQETVESHKFYHNTSEIKFCIDIDLPEEFVSDEFRVRVIINNLLSNAIKYQRKEEAEKQVAVKAEIKDGHAYISIKDNGIGIEEKFLKDIYNMFFRATHHSSGSGIGLYIVKDAVDKLEGEIEVVSNEGNGTTFNIKIPNRNNRI
jgi:two-component system, sensor histidine kinase and response regulator